MNFIKKQFSRLTYQISAELDIFVEVTLDTKFPNSLEATQKPLDDHDTDYERLQGGILATASNLKSNDEIKEYSERTYNSSSIEGTLVHLEETERRFDEF